ncbi:N-terminal acetyltransferase B complex catalytic subunit naa20 [Vanrija pseudolonga]|uniref:N-terminal acetyltransferase B complex catalytic subunit naa20 n=1 Tax=Vanrija pseudolonga TaxID=143232 RepID=A0AAF0XZ79_9TREE|nr:N-terminal acetyltransferase B complex catalytic subunit naa20 [Vanrija pseudolonga]
MSLIRPFEATDILRFHAVNADPWTATYHNGYYASYVAQWPDLCYSVEGAFDDEVRAYMIAKDEPAPPDPQHHGHLTALSISPPYRGLGLARVFMAMLERLSSDGSAGWPRLPPPPSPANGDGDGEHPPPDATDCVDAFFVDLFVRCNNHRAIDMYEKLGYSVYRRVVDYYNGMEGVGSTRDELDGFDMRKSMPKDKDGSYVRANGRETLVSPEEVWA